MEIDWPQGEWDWKPFARACDFHQVAAFVYCQLKHMQESVPPGLLEHLRKRFYEVSTRNYALAKNLVDLSSILLSEGIPVLAYKGPTLAMAVYGDLALRQYQDLDVVVRREDLTKAVAVLSRRGFEMQSSFSRPQMIPYRCDPENPRHVAMAQEIPFRAPDGTYFVDVHWKLGYRFWHAFAPDIEKVWERSEEHDIAPGRVATFSREDLFLALCYHGTKHRWAFLKWLSDIAELLRQNLDWSLIEEMLKARPRLGAAVGVGILLAREMLDTDIPAELLNILPINDRSRVVASSIRREILLHGKSNGSDHATFVQLETDSLTRAKYFAARLVHFPASVLREVFVQVSSKDRALVALPANMQFVYHLIRPVRLVVNHSIRMARLLWRIFDRPRSSASEHV